MSVGLLFEGIGGIGLAAERAGMEHAWSSEIDEHASRVLDHHWPHVKNLGDIHGIADAPGIDVLTGGFPCQDYSVAGTRGGLAGDRGALWWQYYRLITQLRPTWVVGENVPGLLSSNDGRDFETIVRSLTECGYGVAWAVLDAQYFGVAQRRRRVFIVGHSGGEPRPEILALSEGMFGHSEPSRAAWQGVAALTASGLGGGGPDDNLAQAGHVVGFNARQDDAAPAYKQAGTLDAGHPIGAIAFRTNQTGAQGPIHSEEVTDTLAQDHAPAVANQGDGSVGQGASVRRLTPLECERLQGFPDGWTDIPGNSDTQRYRQLGNAVAVPVAEWILRNIVEAA